MKKEKTRCINRAELGEGSQKNWVLLCWGFLYRTWLLFFGAWVLNREIQDIDDDDDDDDDDDADVSDDDDCNISLNTIDTKFKYNKF